MYRIRKTISVDPVIWKEVERTCKQIGLPVSRFIEGLCYLVVSPEFEDETPGQYIESALKNFMDTLKAQGRSDLADQWKEEMEKQLKLFQK